MVILYHILLLVMWCLPRHVALDLRSLLISQCNHSDQLLKTTQSILPHLYVFLFVIAREKKKSRKEKAESPEEGKVSE